MFNFFSLKLTIPNLPLHARHISLYLVGANGEMPTSHVLPVPMAKHAPGQLCRQHAWRNAFKKRPSLAIVSEQTRFGKMLVKETPLGQLALKWRIKSIILPFIKIRMLIKFFFKNPCLKFGFIYTCIIVHRLNIFLSLIN